MSKTLLTLLGLVATISAYNSPVVSDDNQDWSPKGINMVEFKYYFTVMRASLEGTLQGLYADDSIQLQKRCMDQDTLVKIVSIEQILSSGDVLGLFKSSGDLFALAYTFDKTCDLNELFFELSSWAFKNGTTGEQINENFKSNLFSLTGAVNEIAQVFFSGNKQIDFTDLEKAKSQYTLLGKKVGQIFRVIFNFNAPYVPNKDKDNNGNGKSVQAFIE
ncbi:UNKNOWN [Stylonychia lemnae]|uniref:Uncharacterized protein n=1 Tax=Stylonychia lemnae TaxID=5949 RepID=A0A078B350_STYLE|nr:UNKNOWN [Stylonychia lemnae]|eukprot:CDW88945.1 UNKNOWN [Stylonychia lemnae]